MYKIINVKNYPKLENFIDQKTYDSFQSLFKRYPSEKNTNNKDTILSHLDGYVYVDKTYHLLPGRFVKLICIKDLYNIHVKYCGFVIDDNAYSVTIKSDNKFLKVSKRNVLSLMKFSEKDKFIYDLKKL
jgi:hypothetical protein